MEIIKVAVIGMIGALLAVSVKYAKSEFAAYISLGACVVIIFYIVAKLTGMITQIKTLMEYVSIEGDYIEILLKMTGITYITEFASSLCKDMGYSALAVQIENFGKLTLLAVSIPVISGLFEIIGRLA